MTDQTQADRRALGLDVLGTLRGPEADAGAAAEAIEANLGALGSYVVDFALGQVWSRPGLSRRDRSLVVISILTTLGHPNQLRAHVAGGLNHGLPREAIEEVMVQLGGYAGFPCAIEGMNVARQVFRERDGTDALPPSPPAERKDDAQRRADARVVLDRLSQGQPPGGLGVDMGSFTGAAGRFAFGELWSRDQITRRERSLVVCATLLTQGKPEELRFHLRGALNHGATVEELEELMVTAIAYAGFPTGVEGFRVLREVQAQGDG